MAILKCKMCGGNVKAAQGAAYGTCESCATTSTLPKVNEEKIINLFNRANHFRRLNEFDKALGVYENILNEDDANAEAHWGATLCRYGIEYVEDPKTHKRIPVCRRAQYESILFDPDYLAALEYAADEYTKSLYEDEAKIISEIQKGILTISNREKPYDVFICYKETTDSGSRTKDSAIAQEIYYELTKDGYKAFFAKITLEEKLGQEYEPYIFNALNSAKVMLVIATCKENFEAVWVKNEWSRFLSLMKKDRSRLLIPCYKDMDAYDIPDELSNLQSQDMSKVGFMQDILRGVKKVLDANKSAEKPSSAATDGFTAAPGIESLMKRGYLFLEDSEFKQAAKYFDKILDRNPEYASAYVGKLCAELKVTREELLSDYEKPISENSNFRRAIRFANAEYQEKLKGYDEKIKKRLQKEHYNGLIQAKNDASTEDEYQCLAAKFREISGYEDADNLAGECDNQYQTLKERREEREEREKKEKAALEFCEAEERKSREIERKKKQVIGIWSGGIFGGLVSALIAANLGPDSQKIFFSSISAIVCCILFGVYIRKQDPNMTQEGVSCAGCAGCTCGFLLPVIFFVWATDEYFTVSICIGASIGASIAGVALAKKKEKITSEPNMEQGE